MLRSNSFGGSAAWNAAGQGGCGLRTAPSFRRANRGPGAGFAMGEVGATRASGTAPHIRQSVSGGKG